MNVYIEIDNADYEEIAGDSEYGVEMTVYPAIPKISADVPEKGKCGEEYEFELHAEIYSNDVSGLTWSKVLGDLPAGLELDENIGIISGIPEEAGDFTFTVRAVNTSMDLTTYSDSQDITITVNAYEQTPVNDDTTDGNNTDQDNTNGNNTNHDNANHDNTNHDNANGNSTNEVSGSGGGGGGCNNFGFGLLGLLELAAIFLRKH